jgi:uncharacterized protein YbbC (DUF1343 family)
LNRTANNIQPGACVPGFLLNTPPHARRKTEASKPSPDLPWIEPGPIMPLRHTCNRRAVIHALGTASLLPAAALVPGNAHAALSIATGAQTIAANGFAAFNGKRIGLVTNQTGRVGADHLADLMARSSTTKLAAIFAPEHGFRGAVEAGATVASGRDAKTGVIVHSLYGATKSPTPAMLRDIDVLVFDIQDVGVRFYTYISTMGLAMQAAAVRRIPFVVLDRPNPLGGVDVSGFVLEPARKSFVGQYPIPIVHGLTVGELARMIKGERWLPGLENLDLTVVSAKNWTRAMRWPKTELPWIATSPNIPTFEAALVYPGIGIVGETLVNEGRGTPTPFSQFGAPWLDAAAAATDLNGRRLPGVRFEATRYTPQSIPGVAADPRFKGEIVNAVRLVLTDVDAFQPLETGIHAIAHLQKVSRARGVPLLEKLGMFYAISGTARLHTMLTRGADGAAIIASWRDEVQRFSDQRTKYLLY